VRHQPKLNFEIYNNINKCKQKMQANKSSYEIEKRPYATSGGGLKKTNCHLNFARFGGFHMHFQNGFTG